MLEPIASELCRKSGCQIWIVNLWAVWSVNFKQICVQVVCFVICFHWNFKFMYFDIFLKQILPNIHINTPKSTYMSRKHHFLTSLILRVNQLLWSFEKPSPGWNFSRKPWLLMKCDPRTKRNVKIYTILIIHPSLAFHVSWEMLEIPKILLVSYSNSFCQRFCERCFLEVP